LGNQKDGLENREAITSWTVTVSTIALMR
jgi:hypothetical protein